MSWNRWRCLSRLLVAVSILLFSVSMSHSTAFAAERAGVTLPDAADAEGAPLVLNGLALRSVFVFDVYVAGLYLPQRTSDAEAILAADAPRRMVMHFVRDVDKQDLCKGWWKGLKKNSPDADEMLRKDFEKLCGAMSDIQDGQEMTFTYMPQQGTTILFGGEVRETIPGKNFADALWSCWIGPDPDPGKGFKRELLGQD
jgi:hypothetical protein